MLNNTLTTNETQSQSHFPDGFSEVEVSPASGWKPIDTAQFSRSNSPAPPFPLDVLPERLAPVILDAAACKSAPVGYVASSLLSMAGGLIGTSRTINPSYGWYEPPTLWMMIVGAPSSNKSPAIDVCADMISELEGELNADYGILKEAYEEALHIYETQEKAWKELAKKAVKDGEEPPAKPEGMEKPEKPCLKRLMLASATIEQVAELLQQNPRGLMVVRDEMAGLLMNLERYGSGTDRQFYIESSGGRRYTVDIKSRPEALIIPRLLLTLHGGIQPQRLQEIFHAHADDGLSARFLYDWSDSVPLQRVTRGYDKAMLKHIFTRLHGLQLHFNEHGTPQAVAVRVDDDAVELLHAYDVPRQVQEKESDGLLTSHIGKLRGYVVRVAGVLAFLDWAVGSDWDEPTSIDKHTMERAIQLVNAYYLPMARRCFGDMSLPQEQRDTALILTWLAKQRATMFDATLLPRAKNTPLKDRKRRDNAIDSMLELGIIKERGSTTPKGGRPALLYDIHPDLLAQWGRDTDT
jgi:Protein of unknown function (DUF3987)